MVTVVRSPARVSWHVMCNGIFIVAKSTKAEAMDMKRKFDKKMGL